MFLQESFGRLKRYIDHLQTTDLQKTIHKVAPSVVEGSQIAKELTFSPFEEKVFTLMFESKLATQAAAFVSGERQKTLLDYAGGRFWAEAQKELVCGYIENIRIDEKRRKFLENSAHLLAAAYHNAVRSRDKNKVILAVKMMKRLQEKQIHNEVEA